VVRLSVAADRRSVVEADGLPLPRISVFLSVRSVRFFVYTVRLVRGHVLFFVYNIFFPWTWRSVSSLVLSADVICSAR
jgi:hypothetical protein